MKTLNEQIDSKLNTLRRQLEATRKQITALEAYRAAGRPQKRPMPPASKPKSKPAK